MTRIQALKIMNIKDDFSMEELKKKYRSLMMMIHPDMKSKQDYPYSAADLNNAYEYLKNNMPEKTDSDNSISQYKIKWNAPVNPNAYREREILHHVEGFDGEIIGTAVIDRGKYVWTLDEEFSLFSQSILQCGKKILEEYDEKHFTDKSGDFKLLADLTYLLAQQFVDVDSVLKLLKAEDSAISADGQIIYQIDAMVDRSPYLRLSPGDKLFPVKIKNHRLYVCNNQKKELGYISFKDDRLYYGIIPLLERRAAEIKMIVSDKLSDERRRKKYIDVTMYLRLKAAESNAKVDNINYRIEKILNAV